MSPPQAHVYVPVPALVDRVWTPLESSLWLCTDTGCSRHLEELKKA